MSSGVTEFFSDLPILPKLRVTGVPSNVKPDWASPSTDAAST